jgi:hypothetical protein
MQRYARRTNANNNNQNRPNLRKRRGKNQNGGNSRGQIPISYQRTTRTNAPRFQNSENSVTVSHREFVQRLEVIEPSDFKLLTKLTINPGNSDLFPWLSQIARNYETYKFENLTFEYVPQCPSITAGMLLQFIDYDAADPDPINTSAIMNSMGASSVNVFSPVKLFSLQQNLHKGMAEKYIFVGEQGVFPINQDPKTINAGNYFAAADGALEGVIGQLYVRYRVTLKTPVIHQDAVLGDLYRQEFENAHVNHPFTDGVGQWGDGYAIPRFFTLSQGSSWDRLSFTTPGYYIFDWYFKSPLEFADLTTTVYQNNIFATHVPLENQPLFVTADPAVIFGNLYKRILVSATTDTYIDFKIGNGEDERGLSVLIAQRVPYVRWHALYEVTYPFNT